MCGSMADIQSATAEIRRGKKKKKQDRTRMWANAQRFTEFLDLNFLAFILVIICHGIYMLTIFVLEPILACII